MTAKNSRCSGHGFTLIELILTVSMLAIIALVVARILLVGLDTYASVSSRSMAVQQARAGLGRIWSECARLSSATLTGVADTQLDFIDAGGFATNVRQVTIGADMNVWRGNDLLVPSVGFLDFDYWDGLGNRTTDPLAVRRINVELNVLARGGFGAMTFRTEVFPRAFMYNGFQ